VLLNKEADKTFRTYCSI